MSRVKKKEAQYRTGGWPFQEVRGVRREARRPLRGSAGRRQGSCRTRGPGA